MRAFFRTGRGDYGAGDRFIGVDVPAQRRLARRFGELPLDELDALLQSALHEERLVALLILVRQFQRAADDRTRGRIFRFYLQRRHRINNWDLVDTSAEHIVGAWLADRPRQRLDQLASSPHLWSRRIAMLATFHYIKRGESADALRIANRLLEDPHPLIHKATGWMLREVGKRASIARLRAFLRAHAARMPRTMLRYAIERLEPGERQRWMRAGRKEQRVR